MSDRLCECVCVEILVVITTVRLYTVSSVGHYILKFSNCITVTNPSNAPLL